MPRIVVVHPHFAYPGGAGNVALHTCEGLAQRGHDVHVVSLFHDPELELAWPSVTFHQFGGPLTSSLHYWASLPIQHRRIHRKIRELGPDVVIAHVFPANYWAFTLERSGNSPRLIWYCHEPSAFVHDRKVIDGVDWPMRACVLAANPALQVLDRRLVKRADCILTNSQFTAERVRTVYGRSAQVAYPGFDKPPSLPDCPQEMMVLSVGRLTKFKQFDVLILAAAEIKHRGFNVQWEIVGDGEERQNLERLVVDLGLADCVHLRGRLPDAELERWYQRSLAVALCSVDEPLGLVAIEAMARSRAVLCSDSGGFRESVQDRVSGLMFEPGSWLELADKVETLVLQPWLAKEMGEAGAASVAERFAWSSTVDRIEEVIEEMSAKQTGRIERKQHEEKCQANPPRE